MAYRDLREFIRKLEKEGELKRIAQGAEERDARADDGEAGHKGEGEEESHDSWCC